MSSGQKAWEEQQEEQEYRERLQRLQAFTGGAVLTIIDELRRHWSNLSLRETPMTANQHWIAEQIQKELRKLP